MVDYISRRLRNFLKSELDLNKDRLLAELRYDSGDLGGTKEQVEDFENRLATMAQQHGLTLKDVKHEFIMRGMKELNSLVLNCDAKIDVQADGRLGVKLGTASFVPETFQEILILCEIFRDEIYLVESGAPFYVWDIGANVGTASIYFATVLGWDVSAYEIFPKIASIAQQNIDRSGLTQRIRLNPFGLGAKTEELTLMYNEQSRGSNGLYGNTDPALSGEQVAVSVGVVDVADEFKKVQELAAGRPILAKLDCEGAEYDILPRLIEAGLMRDVTSLVMEEHILPGKDREQLVRQILDAGFVVRRTRRPKKEQTMLFASRLGA